MKKWLKAYLLLEEDVGSNTYRKEVTGNFVILFSFFLLLVLTISNYFYNDIKIFWANFALLLTLGMTFFLFKRSKKYIVHAIAVVMGLGIFWVVYLNQGQDYTPIWSFLFIYLIMSLYGHKKGLYISIGFLTCLFVTLFSWIGDSVGSLEFIRFTFVSIFTLFFAYLAEVLISRTFEQLHATKRVLENMTKTDELTGLHNRRYFNEMLEKSINSTKRSKELLAFAIIDIDHFKRHNDTYGHPAGDKTLAALSSLLKSKMQRSDDMLFRLGGEEFAILYKPKDESGAMLQLESIRKSVEQLHQHIDIADSITISAGLYLIKPQEKNSFEHAYKSADELLYRAKALGRNRVVVSP